MKIKRIEKFFIICLLIFMLFFVSAQQGCESTQASKQGLGFTLISKPGFLTSGSRLHQEDSFYVGIKIENYDTKERLGTLCIKDDVDEAFGGIQSQGFGECQYFVVRAAEKKQETKKSFFGQAKEDIKPGVTEVYFPQEQEYKYYGMPVMLQPFSVNLYVSLHYNEMTQATATITTGQEQPNVAQEPALVKVSVLKSLHPRSEGYKIDLTINLVKQGEGKIFLPDFSKENSTQFSVQLYNIPLDCFVAGKPVYGVVELQDTKTIKCSGTIYSRQEQSFPLIVTLNYGVIIDKKFPFSIITKEE
ncbi:MAG: hypothetical protein QXQ82_01445 [Candidatus Pacearchaeota archaeon]